MLTQMRVQVGQGFIDLYLISDGRIVVVPSFGFMPTFEHKTSGVSYKFDKEGFSLKAEGDDTYQDYEYQVAYPYKEMPTLKQWLIEENLQWPI